ncbi:MAG TPA: VOC family protein [Chitinophagaceae bacterium]|nr:VOC family protein [Chitinophagaceae bacterium]
MINKIYPCLWFDGNAEAAARYYCSVFRNSEIVDINPIVATFKSAGQRFMCLNGGPMFTKNPSISFYVVCETEEEADSYWNALTEGGKVLMPLDKYDWSEKYGWVQDKFGVSWQLALGKMEAVGQKFTPVLMFTGDQSGNAGKAIETYTSIFPGSSVVGVMKYPPGQKDEGLVMHAQFKLEGQVFMCMDSSLPHGFGFNEAISLVIECEDQAEIDRYWEKLTAGGEESMCGWLKDRYGVSWQVVPKILGQLMSNPERAGRVMQAFMKMKKFNIQQLMDA